MSDQELKVESDLISQSLKGPAREFLTDLSELGLDELLGKVSQESELLKQLPVVKWIFLAKDVSSSIQNVFFLKKYSCFIGQISKSVSGEYYDGKMKALVGNKDKFRSLVGETILYLDRCHNEFKAKLIGELFIQFFVHINFSQDEYNSLLFSVESIHPYEGIEKLREFYEYRNSFEAAIDREGKDKIRGEGSKLEYHALSMSGLLKLPRGGMIAGDYGGAYLNDLGKRFYEHVVLNVVSETCA